MEFPPHLLDELARVFAEVALDRLLRDAVVAADQARDESTDIQRLTDAESTAEKSPPCGG